MEWRDYKFRSILEMFRFPQAIKFQRFGDMGKYFKQWLNSGISCKLSVINCQLKRFYYMIKKNLIREALTEYRIHFSNV